MSLARSGRGQDKEIWHIQERKQMKIFLQDWLKSRAKSSLVNYQHRIHTDIILMIHMLEVRFPVSTKDNETYRGISAGL